MFAWTDSCGYLLRVQLHSSGLVVPLPTRRVNHTISKTNSISPGSYIGFAADDNNQWRVSLGIQNVPAGILALLILLFPESPRWLIQNGRTEEGLQTLAKLHAHGDVNDAWVVAEFSQIEDTITIEREGSAKSYAELFTDRSCFRRLFLACALQASVQMTGVSAIQYYSLAIYEKIGIAGDDALKYQAISSCIVSAPLSASCGVPL